jgi:iron-sulfur cluster repair protein YtfE (RIC family)
MKTIKNIMDIEHKRIQNLLKEFEDTLNKDFKKAKEIFSKFDWNLEKHFYIEEKVIFTIYNASSGIDDVDLTELIKEHKDIVWKISRIKENLDRGIKPHIEDLKKLLNHHEKFEDEVFYPRLDEELNKSEKELIFERAEEIING